MEESGTERKEKEVEERKAKEENEKSSRNEKERMEELRKSEVRKNSGSRSRRAEMGGGGNLPASLVRAFLHPSCPSFGCFHGRHLVGSFTPGRRAAREREGREKESDSEESGKEDEVRGGGGGGRLLET